MRPIHSALATPHRAQSIKDAELIADRLLSLTLPLALRNFQRFDTPSFL